MKSNMVTQWTFLLCFLSVGIAAETSNFITDKHLNTFDFLIQGEFDNYNQFNFENNDLLNELDRVKDKHTRMYMRITKVNAPQIGDNVYYQQMHSGDRHSPIYRQVLLVVKPDYKSQRLAATGYKFKQPEKYRNLWEASVLTELTKSDLKTIGENCNSDFKWVSGVFIAEMRYQDCIVPSKHGGVVHISSKTVISEDEYWHIEGGYNAQGDMRFGRADGVPIKMRRAKRFSCWAALKTAKKKENGEYEWDFHQNLLLHNQGDVVHFSRSDVSDRHYFMRLQETIFPAGKRPDVLALFVHQTTEEAITNDKKALAETWTNTNANRLGLNLRWFQGSCSRDVSE